MNPAAVRGFGTFGRIRGSGGVLPEAQDTARRRGGALETGMNLPLGERERAAPSPHFHLQPAPACVGEVLSIACYF